MELTLGEVESVRLKETLHRLWTGKTEEQELDDAVAAVGALLGQEDHDAACMLVKSDHLHLTDKLCDRLPELDLHHVYMVEQVVDNILISRSPTCLFEVLCRKVTSALLPPTFWCGMISQLIRQDRMNFFNRKLNGLKVSGVFNMVSDVHLSPELRWEVIEQACRHEEAFRRGYNKETEPVRQCLEAFIERWDPYGFREYQRYVAQRQAEEEARTVSDSCADVLGQDQRGSGPGTRGSESSTDTASSTSSHDAPPPLPPAADVSDDEQQHEASERDPLLGGGHGARQRSAFTATT